MFQSIEKSFASLLENQADIKESIPQFYDTKGGVDFLLNTRGLQLGITQNGHIIDDVELPKWAKSPKDFVKKNRQALESDYCTKYLPSWIDLIFGVKARGEQALEANNLFHPTSYVSPIEYQRMAGAEKFQAELQATEVSTRNAFNSFEAFPFLGYTLCRNDKFKFENMKSHHSFLSS